MHKKLLHHITYSPALAEQLAKHDKKLKIEIKYRKISLGLMIISFLLYVFVVISTSYRLEYVANTKLADDIRRFLSEFPSVHLFVVLIILGVIILFSLLVYLRLLVIRKLIKSVMHSLHQGSI